MTQTYTRSKGQPSQLAVSSQEAVATIASDDEWDATRAPLVFTPGADGSVQRVATDASLLSMLTALQGLGTQTTLAAVLAALASLNNQQVLFAGTPTTPPVLHRTAVTAADTVNPTNPTTVGGAVHFSGAPGWDTRRQYVDFDIDLTVSAGTGTALVQMMIWDAAANSSAGAWYGGDYQYLTTSPISTSIPTQTQPATCPCTLRFETRGRIVYLRVRGIAGTSAALSAYAAAV